MIRLRRCQPTGLFRRRRYEVELLVVDGSIVVWSRETTDPVTLITHIVGVAGAWALVEAADGAWRRGSDEWMSLGDNVFVSDQSQRIERREKNWARAKKLGKLAFGLVGFLFCLLGIFGLAAPSLDQINPIWTQCEVYSSAPFHGGRGGTSYAVILSTNCGQVWVAKGVDSDNVNQVARAFRPKTDYEFKFGWLSQIVLHPGQLHLVNATAQDWRKVSPS